MNKPLPVICTLFEGDYHFGVAALANSLSHCGFEGLMYAGHRGPLPAWGQAAQAIEFGPYDGARSLQVSAEFRLIFLPLDTRHHLSNYKPDFMLELLAHGSPDTESIFYFDPDICVFAPWSFFLDWINSGIAMAEDINSPYLERHPRRMAWRQYFGQHSQSLAMRFPEYLNSGFIGLSRPQFPFLDAWKRFQDLMAPMIGGLEKSAFQNSLMSAAQQSTYYPFSRPDQDALNAALEASTLPVSILGKHAMGFAGGEVTLPHAVGSPKPWNKSYLRETILKARPPSMAEKAYWHFASAPLLAHSRGGLMLRRFIVAVCALLGRFYRQGGLA